MSAEVEEGAQRRLAGRSRLAVELAVAALTGLAGAVTVLGSAQENVGWGEDGPAAGYFPFRVGLIVLAASLGIALQAVLRHRRAGPFHPGLPSGPFASRAGLQRVLAILLPTIVCCAAMPWLGLYVPSAAYIVFIMRRQGGYGWPTALAVSIGIMAFFFVMFEQWFQVPLAKGPVETLLGLD